MIFGNTHLEKTQFLLERAMDTEMLRRKVISDNIANADTPHYKRTEVTFEAQLRRAMDSEKKFKEESLPARKNDLRHFDFDMPLDYRNVQAKTKLDYLSTMRNDGNNIDVEVEVQNMLKNQLRYQAATQAYAFNTRTLYTVMRAP